MRPELQFQVREPRVDATSRRSHFACSKRARWRPTQEVSRRLAVDSGIALKGVDRQQRRGRES
jgi:hypothetical protein